MTRPVAGGPGRPDRRVLVVAHTGRGGARDVAAEAVRLLLEAGMGVRLLKPEAADLGPHDNPAGEPEVVEPAEDVAAGCELVLVVGGDGTILRAAELARDAATPLLGVNLGHVGFLAEAESEDVASTIDAVVHCRYSAEERMTLDVSVHADGHLIASTWALNEATVEKASRQRMLEVIAEVDDRPLSRWGCDGVVCATPTGSTAYNFSAGGPIVWPELDALLMVPLSAHALFARPLVVAPTSVLAIEVVSPDRGAGTTAVLWADGRRMVELPVGARIEVRRGALPVRLVRLHEAPFTDRLVAKFDLPVDGWRGLAARRRRAARPERT